MDKYVNELKHFGRKGMKWYQNIFSKEQATSSKGSEGDEKSSNSSTGRVPISQMSDSELKDRTNRLRLENDYREAISKRSQSSAASKAKSFLSSHASRIIGNTIDNIGTQALTHMLGNLINKQNKTLGKNPFNKTGSKEERDAWYQYDTYHRTVNPQKGQKEK